MFRMFVEPLSIEALKRALSRAKEHVNFHLQNEKISLVDLSPEQKAFFEPKAERRHELEEAVKLLMHFDSFLVQRHNGEIPAIPVSDVLSLDIEDFKTLFAGPDFSFLDGRHSPRWIKIMDDLVEKQKQSPASKRPRTE